MLGFSAISEVALSAIPDEPVSFLSAKAGAAAVGLGDLTNGVLFQGGGTGAVRTTGVLTAVSIPGGFAQATATGLGDLTAQIALAADAKVPSAAVATADAAILIACTGASQGLALADLQVEIPLISDTQARVTSAADLRFEVIELVAAGAAPASALADLSTDLELSAVATCRSTALIFLQTPSTGVLEGGARACSRASVDLTNFVSLAATAKAVSRSVVLPPNDNTRMLMCFG